MNSWLAFGIGVVAPYLVPGVPNYALKNWASETNPQYMRAHSVSYHFTVAILSLVAPVAALIYGSFRWFSVGFDAQTALVIGLFFGLGGLNMFPSFLSAIRVIK